MVSAHKNHEEGVENLCTPFVLAAPAPSFLEWQSLHLHHLPIALASHHPTMARCPFPASAALLAPEGRNCGHEPSGTTSQPCAATRPHLSNRISLLMTQEDSSIHAFLS
jgi:hypothetical protein